jgi:ATP-binding cassette subfamily B protein
VGREANRPEVAVESHSAYVRASAFLRFAAGWVWTARVAAVLAALCTAGLFIVFGFFVDLVVYQGRIPEYTQLSTAQRQHYDAAIKELSSERRQQLVLGLNPPLEVAKQFDAEMLPLSDSSREWLWRGYVGSLLDAKVSSAAGDKYRAMTSGPGCPDSPQLGLLSLVVRRTGILQSLLGKFAGWNSWTWRPADKMGPNFPYLVGLTILAIALAFGRAGFLNLLNYSAASATLDATSRMRRALYQHSSRLGTLALNNGTHHDSLEIFGKRVETVHDGLFAGLTTLVHAPVELALLLLLAFLTNVWLALACLVAGAIVILVGGYLAAQSRFRSRVETRRTAGQLHRLEESLNLMRLVKSNLMDVFNQSRVERQLADYSQAAFRRFRHESMFRPLLVFMATITGIIVLAVAGWAVLQGHLGVGRLALVAALFATAYWPFANLLEARRQIRKGREAAVPIMEFLDRPGEVGQIVGAEFLPGISRGIEFRNVNLREPGSGKLILNDLSLKVKAGQRVAIVGPSNEEKHAIIYLLQRFIDATTGDITIDDKSLKWLTLDSLRAQVGTVMWDDLVFNDTVANNIGCGDPSVSLPQIIECAKIAHAHQFIQRLPYGYETPIGEMGTQLRRSQKFRIALARAILKDPSLYVIEEPPSPFDSDHKGLIDDCLSRVLPGKTVIFLAHRISTIRSCDVVYLIHKGRVEAFGEHRELVNRSDLYKHLHYMEFNEFAAQH